MTFKTENIIEITWILKEHALWHRLLFAIPFEELKEIIDRLSDKFETLHCNTDWNELDYSEEIHNFTNKEIALELCHRLADIPINPSTQEIEKPWSVFSVGTRIEDIWDRIEETFDVCMEEDLM